MVLRVKISFIPQRRTTNWIIILYVSTTLSYSVLGLPQGSYNHNLHQQPQSSYNSQFNNNNANQFQNSYQQQGQQPNNNYNNPQLPVSALHSGNSNALSQSQYPVPPPPPGQSLQQQQQPQKQQSFQQAQTQKLNEQAYLQNKQNQYFQQQYQNSVYNRNQVPITSFNNDQSHDGSFAYGYTTGDGQHAQAQGFVKNLGNKELEAQVVQGAYSYTSPDGTPISVKYLADENGYRPEGLHLPTPPPIPKEILRALEYIARVQATNPQLYQQNQQQFSGNYNQLG